MGTRRDPAMILALHGSVNRRRPTSPCPSSPVPLQLHRRVAGIPQRSPQIRINRMPERGDSFDVAWVGYGNALYGLGRAAEAAGCYDRALAIDPSDAPTLANRAWARLASGDRAGAERDVEAVTALGHPIDPDLRAALRDAGDPPV
ncbi:MAG: tetratricopeptide repeat protein, partial [Planctomycetia bacterium]|nr:tetratricopeptide repeat protein [Planctomycetia bacterium]